MLCSAILCKTLSLSSTLFLHSNFDSSPSFQLGQLVLKTSSNTIVVLFAQSFHLPHRFLYHSFRLNTRHQSPTVNVSSNTAMESFEMWQCHECKASPHVYKTTKACPNVLADGRQCGHEVCKLCPKDKAISPPLPSQQEGLRAPSPMMRPTFDFHRSRTRAFNGLSSRPGRPSMRGWWKCCSCENDNNPDLAKTRCSSCGHKRGYHCTDY
jgi:hypothetical protein